MAVGVADGIHILSRYYDELLEHPDTSASDAVMVTMGEMWQPVVLTSLTTAAGFLSFLTTAIVPIRYFWAVYGGRNPRRHALLTDLFAGHAEPAVADRQPGPAPPDGPERGSHAATGWGRCTCLSRLGRGVARHPFAVWVPAATRDGAICLIGAQRIVVDSIDRSACLTHSTRLRIGDEVLRDKFQGTVPIYVAIEGHAPDRLKDPVLLDQLDRLQADG